MIAPATKFVRITAPHFVHGIESDGVVRKTDRPLRFMLGWPDDQVRDYVARRDWKAAIVKEPVPHKIIPAHRRLLERADADGILEFDLMCEISESSWRRTMHTLGGHRLVEPSDYSSSVFQITDEGRAALAVLPPSKRDLPPRPIAIMLTK